MDATKRGDTAAIVALLYEDISFAMPRSRGHGRDAMWSWRPGLSAVFGTAELGALRCVFTAANMQPAVAGYRRHAGEAEYRPLALVLLRVVDGLTKQIITFEPKVSAAFGRHPLASLIASLSASALVAGRHSS